jgi:hypothetical protein
MCRKAKTPNAESFAKDLNPESLRFASLAKSLLSRRRSNTKIKFS